MKIFRTIILFALAMVMSLGTLAQRLTIAPYSVYKGTTSKTMSLCLESEEADAYMGFQADIKLPQGFGWSKTERGSFSTPKFNADSGRTSSDYHTVSVAALNDGSIRIVCYSVNNSVFLGKSGAVLDLPIIIDENIAIGDYEGILRNIVITTPDQKQTKINEFRFAMRVEQPIFQIKYVIDDKTFKVDSAVVGTKLQVPLVPEKEGYSFTGWKEVPELMPNHDLVVIGEYVVNKYLRTYMIDGEIYMSDSIAYGSTLIPIAAPDKEGYTFSGWSEFPSTMPACNITVTGSFIPIKYNLSYYVDGVLFSSEDVAFGTELKKPIPPIREGYEFVGWDDIPSTMPANDVVLRGVYLSTKMREDVNSDGSIDSQDVLEIYEYMKTHAKERKEIEEEE